MGELWFYGIRCKGDRLQEIDSGRIMVEVLRSEIRSIALRHGLPSPHPVLQAFAGLVLGGAGLLGAVGVLAWLLGWGLVIPGAAWLAGLAPIGGWLIWTALRRALFLEVQLDRGCKRLTFNGKPTDAEVQTFVAALREELQFPVTGHEGFEVLSVKP